MVGGKETTGEDSGDETSGLVGTVSVGAEMVRPASRDTAQNTLKRLSFMIWYVI